MGEVADIGMGVGSASKKWSPSPEFRSQEVVPLKISLSNPNIDVRILAQGNCVTIVGPSLL